MAHDSEHGSVGDIVAPPEGSRIRLLRDSGRTTIVLPRAIHRGGLWMGYAFCAPFVALPLTIAPNFSGFVLHLVGLFLLSIVLVASWSRQVVRCSGDAVEFETELFGRCLHVRPMTRRQIHDVAIRAVTQQARPGAAARRRARAVYVENDAGKPICLGPSLDDVNLEWLRDALRSIAV